ncbi:hypothetical protein OSB04_011634 [Centaurea solstitialis]|uniref:Reverse transcriptase domain-containing protein n=1 Tax=Centaurea solstitialis TaxID=347529 RepID=A0AA38TLJ2_9ASTR|nr:hypothetical protein OSB04_011634 [Centaurea solstitialis]
MGFEDILGDAFVQPTRKSVFDRLSDKQKEDTVFKEGDVKGSFASVVGDSGSDSLTFFPLENKAQSRVVLPIELAKEVMKNHHTTLYGYFLGPRVPFPIVESYVKNSWSKFGFVKAMMNNNGIMFFKFNDLGGCTQVIANGPLMIRGVPLFIAQWDPLKGLTKPVHNTCPLWVKLHNVPLVAFNKEGISRIASVLGVPKQMDACTASKAWGRPGFAKVLIEVWAVGTLKREVEVVIPNLSGGVDSTVTIKVEYVWEPSQCSHCLVFGHSISSCAKAVASQHKSKKGKVVDDGFVTVEKRQWRPKVIDKPSSSGTSVEGVVEKPVGSATVTILTDKEVEKSTDDLDGMVDKEAQVAEADCPIPVSSIGEEQIPFPVFRPPNADFVRTSRGVPDVPFRQSVVNTVKSYSARRGVFVPESNPVQMGGDDRNNAFSPLANLGDHDTGAGIAGSKPKVGSGSKDKGSADKSTSGGKRNRDIPKDGKGESHLSSQSLVSVVNSVFGRWSWISNQNESLHGTRIILAWNADEMDVMVIETHAQYVHCEIRLRGLVQSWFCTVVYGANNGSLRRHLWSGLRKFRVIMGNQPWAIMGDFNAMLFPHDALGGMSRRNADMVEFFECVDDIEVFDVSYTGIQHTWCQKPKEDMGLHRKLDRIMANVEFTTRFEDAHARFFPRGISDHSPGVLVFKGGRRKRKMGFKFDNFLVEHPLFLSTVKTAWEVPVEGTFMYRVTSRLKALKEPLRKLLVQILLYPRSQDEEIILKSKKVKQSQRMEVKEESQASKSKKEALINLSARGGICQRMRACENAWERLTMDSDFTELQTAAVDAYVNDLLNPNFFESINQRVNRFTDIIWKLKKENISLTDQVVTHEKSTSSQQTELIIKVTNLEDSLSKERSLITSLKKDLQNEHDQMLKHSFGNAQNLKLVTSLRKENECLKKKVLELDEDKKVFKNKLISSQSRVMELSKQVTDFEQIVIIEQSNFEKERKVFEEERNVFVNERKSFELESEKLSQKISDLERKFLIDKKEFERQMKSSLKKPSLRAGKYQNMMHEFEEEIQVVHLDRKVDDKKSIELQKQIVDLQNQLSDVRHQFKQKEKVLRHEKTILEQIIAEPNKPTLVEKDFADQKEAFKAEINKLTSKLSGLSTDIMNEQQMRSDQQKKLNDLLEERNKLSSKVKELEEIIFKAHDSSNVDSASRSHINSSGQIRTSNLFYDCHVDRSGIHRYSNGKFVWQVKGSSTKDIEVSMINPEPEDLPKKHIPRLDLVCEGVNEKLRRLYGNLTGKVDALKEELNVIQLACDLDPFNAELKEDLQGLREVYQQACRDENLAMRQRAKVHWLREGDANTRFFHNVVKERRHYNQVRSVCRNDGVFVYDEDVPWAFVDHLKGYMGSMDESLDPLMPMEWFHNKLSLRDSLFIIRPILDSEIRDAMFQIGKDKAPGSDGFTSIFFKAAWEVVGNDVIVAIHNFFYRGHLAKELNHTLLCLLPKCPNASSVADFRPISCCSVLYKCISKIIVNRMKPFLDGLVGRAQSAFIPGRRIVDNILMAHELVVGYHLNSGSPRCAFKIDLRKAYDMVDWRFLCSMLEGFGFHPVLVKWIKEMISTTTYSVAVNGESWGHFHGKRGIRQGDPLSPYLFTLVMEGFAMIFRQCIEEASQFIHHPGCEAIELTHLCFADDLFVFTGGDVDSVEVLKKALFLFEKRSGLSPNLTKSDIFFGNVSDSAREAILNCLPFRMGTFPIRYLGVPLSPVFLRVSDYGGMIARVKQRIQNWKMKFLSFGGRRQLVRSVLQSLQLYWMAIFVFPASVIHELEALLRAFLWAQGDDVHGKCRISWEVVCRPTDCGGLGFKKLATWNRALIAKNLWDVLVHRPTLWVSWVRQLPNASANFWKIRESASWSWVLRRMMSLRHYIRQHVKVTIGDGRSTHAWEDTWLDCGSLGQLVTYRRIHSQGVNVENLRKVVEEILNYNMNPINKREDLAMGSDSKAPVLFKDEYELWVARFRLFIKRKDKGNLILKSIDYGAKPLPMHTVNGMRVVKEVEEMDEAEKTQYLIDLEAQNCLIQAIPNDIYRKLDSYDDSAKSIWDQLEKIMLGSKVGNQLRITTLMDKYENFKMKDGESLEDAYDGFVILMNDMKKNRIHRSEMDFSVKFINNLSLEWKPFTRFVKQHKALNELKVYEVFENLKLFEEEVEEAVLEKQKKEKAEQESLALLTERKKGKSVIKKGKAKVFEVDDDEDEEESEDEERDLMFQSLLTLTEAYRKKYYNKPSSNNRRFASRGRNFNRSGNLNQGQMYTQRNSGNYVDKYANKGVEEEKETAEVAEEKKTNDNITCFKCGKKGHVARICPAKMSKVEILKKKLELAEKQEQGFRVYHRILIRVMSSLVMFLKMFNRPFLVSHFGKALFPFVIWEQLVISVLQSLQLYWMQIFVFPSVVVHKIEGLFRDFLWAQGDSSRGRCKVAWADVCRPIQCGGLGFKRLTVWNRSLITKNLWAILIARNCLWVRWIKRYSLRDVCFWNARSNNRWSWVLRKMLNIRHEIRRFVSYKVGNGNTPNAWEDTWLPCGPLSAIVPYRLIHAAFFTVETSVRTFVLACDNGWPSDWLMRYPILSSITFPTLDDNVEDMLCWDVSTSDKGDFTVQRAYHSFIGPIAEVSWARCVWFKGHIPKHAFCLWLACLGRLPTQDRIFTWKTDPPDLSCSLCKVCDSHAHLFFDCTVARQVWIEVLAKLDWSSCPLDWDGIMQCISNVAVGPRLLAHRIAIASAVYTIWCERNKRLFEDTAHSVPHLVKTILSTVHDRVAWTRRKKKSFIPHVVS